MVSKICIVNFNIYYFFNPKSKAPIGGAELDLYTLASGLKNKYSISVITSEWGQKEREEHEGIEVIRSIKLGSGGYVSSILTLWKKLREVKADVYISSGAGPEVGIIALFCKLNKKKYIYRTASEIDCNEEYIKNNGFKGALFKFGLKNSSAVVTSVKKHVDLLKDNYPKLKKVEYIGLGLNFRDKQKIEDKKYILWVSRCSTIKRPEIFLKIAQKIPLEKFLMICPRNDDNPGLFDSIKNKSEKIANLIFIDFVPFQDIQPYFNSAKICLNTSDFEGFTYTLIQSGIAGTPVAYLNVNPDQVITKFDLGEFADGSVDKLIAKVKLLLDDKKLWQKKSEAINKYIKTNHSMANLSHQWIKLFDSIK